MYPRPALLFRLILAFFTAFVLSFAVSCSSTEKIDTDTAEGAYALAKKYEKDERYEEAITYFQDVKNKHPYSSLAIVSELAIADIEFKRESFAEAETDYRLFKELHPTNDKMDYVTFRLGLSIFKQLPSTIDRDLAEAARAILYFDEVITSYPNSTYVKDAKESRQKAQTMLAEKAYYIAEFYFKREKWESALGRFEDIMNSHAGLGFDKKALYGAAISALRMKDRDKAKQYVSQLEKRFPKSDEYARVKREIK